MAIPSSHPDVLPLVLHHYPRSPFSEKVRLALGVKNLAWHSVHVPVVMPKPDLVALTGGYRRAPVLQIGADIYCDTALICKVLEQRQPQPSLYPPSIAGEAQLIAQWADSALFWTAIPYAMQPAGQAVVFAGLPAEAVQAFAADRAALTAGMRRPGPADAAAALHTYLAWLDGLLHDGRPFIAGPVLSIADLAVAHSLWYVRNVPPLAGILAPHERLQAWLGKVLAGGHGEARPMTSDDAIALAAAASQAGRHAPVAVLPDLGFEAGDTVEVSAADYGVEPVHGSLVGLTQHSVTLCRRDARAGVLQVHFPRVGFRIRAGG